MKLTEKQRGMLAGEQGGAAAKAMEILVALGEVFDAPRLLPVRSVQVSGVSYSNLGDEGLAWLEALAGQGRAVVPATLNPAGMDLRRPERMALSADFVARQLRVIDAYRRLGIAAACTCTPYLAGIMPTPGETIAWSESSAVTFANSVLGARTNREGGPSALAAALCGVTPLYGLHVDAERRPTFRVVLDWAPSSDLDWGLIGLLVGRLSEGRIPLIQASGPPPRLEALKTLSAALPTYGGAPMFHVAGVTPEAARFPVPAEMLTLSEGAVRTEAAARAVGGEPVDLVCLGCPHATLDELQEVAERLDGRPISVELWVCTSRAVKALADDLGLTERIERTGAKVLCDTCFVVAPLKGVFRSVATNSAKGIYYASGHGGMDTRLLSTRDCVEGAVTGRFA